jgi:hypothetical protein
MPKAHERRGKRLVGGEGGRRGAGGREKRKKKAREKNARCLRIPYDYILVYSEARFPSLLRNLKATTRMTKFG